MGDVSNLGAFRMQADGLTLARPNAMVISPQLRRCFGNA
jgi:hypothetical protein